MRMEGNRKPRSRSLSGSCAYAGEHTAEGIGIRFYGIPEGKEQSDDLREIPRIAVQVSEPGILVSRVLCGHSGKECEEDRRVHPASTG